MIEAEAVLPELPDSWLWTRLGDISTIEAGGTPATKDPNNFGGNINWVTPADLSGFDSKFISKGSRNITEKGLRVSSAKMLPAGTVIFSSRAPIGYVAIAQNPLCTNQGCKNFILPSGIFNEYLFYYLKGNKSLAESYASGTTFLELSAKRAAMLPVPLSPSNEQQRIVARIEELFSYLDAGVEALQKAKVQLRHYRQSVLKAAVEGRLTEEWRKEHPEVEPEEKLLEQISNGQQGINRIREEKSENLNISVLSEIPKNWLLVKISDVGYVQLGRQRAPKHHFGEHMRQYLRVANVFENRIDTSDILMMNFTPSEFKTYQLRYGDILLNEGQSLELIGRPAIYRDELPGSCFQNTLVRFTPFKGVDPEYSLSVFRSYFHNGMFQKIAKWTTTMAHLGAGRFSNLTFPLPPLLEQKEIASEISRIESVVENTGTSIDSNLKRTDRLRQSILKRAFKGRLVPQDPSDEPASILLERIKSERSGQISMKSKRERPSNIHQMRLIQ